MSNLESIAVALREAAKFGAIEPQASTDGFSGEKVTGLLQRLARLREGTDAAVYLEVGIYRGRTLLSVAAAAPDVFAVGIDNFSQFDPGGENRSIVEAEARRLGCSNVRLIDADYEVALPTLTRELGGRRVGLYFVDGPHDYRSQRMSLELALPALADDVTIVVDDANYLHVRQADRDFLSTRPEYRLLFEAYSREHPINADLLSLEAARKGWWNGIHLLSRDAAGALPTMLPEVDGYRRLAEGGHVVDGARFGPLAPEAVELASALLRLRPFRSLRGVARLARARGRLTANRIGRYEAGNTFSEGLPAERVNPGLERLEPQRG